MKKLLILSIFLITSLLSQASHIQGGTIYWECTPDGRYIFFGEFYRDCIGPAALFDTQLMLVSGSPLPRNGFNQTMDSLLLFPDSVKWEENNFGFVDTTCSSTSGRPCDDYTVYQQFYFKSDTLELNGTPPNQGWNFVWFVQFNRGGVLNTEESDILFRATMYQNNANGTQNKCFDNPPQFIERGVVRMCNNSKFRYQNRTFDKEGDSVSYAFDRLLGRSFGSSGFIRPAVYNTGYSFTNPTPDQNFDSRNLPSTLNATNGEVSLAIYAHNSWKGYATIIRADSWKNGQKVASIFSDRIISIEPCNGFINNTPFLLVNGDTLQNDTLRVVIGDRLDLSFTANDLDTAQTLYMSVDGDNFSSTLFDSTSCSTPPCSYLSSDSSFLRDDYGLNFLFSRDSIDGTLSWRPTSNHLLNDSCSVYQLNFYLFDNHCPVPLTNNQKLTIIVAPDSSTCGALSVKQHSRFSSEVKAFPNPTSGSILMQLERTYQKIDIRVRNLQGQLVQEDQFRSARNVELDIQAKAGVYFVELLNEKGEKTNLKVIKK